LIRLTKGVWVKKKDAIRKKNVPGRNKISLNASGEFFSFWMKSKEHG